MLKLQISGGLKQFIWSPNGQKFILKEHSTFFENRLIFQLPKS